MPDQLLKIIPPELANFVGLFVLLIIFAFLQEWLKLFVTRGNRRSDRRMGEDGSEGETLQATLMNLVREMQETNKQLRAFTAVERTVCIEVKETLDEVSQRQKRHWERLFDQEIPDLHKSINLP